MRVAFQLGRASEDLYSSVEGGSERYEENDADDTENGAAAS